MKRSLRNSILLLLTAMLLTVSALADSGPKAQLTVKVVNAPSEPYYLDLLEKGDYQGHTYGSGDGDDTYSGLDWSYSEEEITALDDELLDALRAAVPEGWHACTAQGTNGAPMWGDLIGSDAGGVRLHSFRYHGVPDTYRIILVTKSGESWVSDTLHRATLQSSATVDWAKRTGERAERGDRLSAAIFLHPPPYPADRGRAAARLRLSEPSELAGVSAREPCDARRLRALPCRDGAQPRRERVVAAVLHSHRNYHYRSRAAVLPPAADGEGPRARGGLRRRRKCLLRDGGVAGSSTRCGGSSSAFLRNYFAPRTGAETKGNFFMETEKLYYADPFLTEFDARVLACEAEKGGYAVVLDRTAFYPEGGGQPYDTGVLGGVEVSEVHEKAGVVTHKCAAPLPVGETVHGKLDWARRFDHMQQHSGEHICSGLICARYGCDNVGFHMGAESVTIDFNADIPWEELLEIEAAANRYIYEDHAIDIQLHRGAELDAIDYRSKKPLEGDVRIVTFPGADCCACCGTHVMRSGQVGIVKFLSVQKFREGVRIELLCGGRAYPLSLRLLGAGRGGRAGALGQADGLRRGGRALAGRAFRA